MPATTELPCCDLRLMPFEECDVPRLIDAVPDARFLLQWGGPAYRFPLDLGQLEAALVTATRPDSDHLIFKAVSRDAGEVVGHVEILRIDRTARTASIGRILVIDPRVRGRGCGERIVAAALEFAFDTLRLDEIDLGVFEFNRAAIRCYSKLGFEVCDIRADARQFRDELWTLVMMKLTRDAWRGGKA